MTTNTLAGPEAPTIWDSSTDPELHTWWTKTWGPDNPISGQFTSLDPIYGGNTTPYAYPQDPVDGYDLNGRWGISFGGLVKVVATVVKYCSYVPEAVGTICSGTTVGTDVAQRNWRKMGSDSLDMGLSVIGGKAVGKVGKELAEDVGRAASKRAKHIDVSGKIRRVRKAVKWAAEQIASRFTATVSYYRHHQDQLNHLVVPM